MIGLSERSLLMQRKTVKESRVIQTRLVLPPDTNHIGTIFGGKILAYIDEVAALSAMKHANAIVVTASIDSVSFLSAAKVGDALTLEAFVTYTGRTSMEVYVKVSAENFLHAHEKLTTEAFLTMVAVDEHGKPIKVPEVIPESEEEKRLFETAPARREKRMKRRKLGN